MVFATSGRGRVLAGRGVDFGDVHLDLVVPPTSCVWPAFDCPRRTPCLDPERPEAEADRAEENRGFRPWSTAPGRIHAGGPCRAECHCA